MKVICTEKEKDTILDMVLASGDVCLFEHDPPRHCRRNCVICVEELVEWEIAKDSWGEMQRALKIS